MLEQFIARVEGHADSWLAQRVSRRAEKTLRGLIVSATTMWHEEGFKRKTDEEICCTVCLFDCCERVVESDQAEYERFRIIYGAAQPSAGMRAGVVHPKRAPIPDISILIGPVTIRVEAKRISLNKGLTGKYVREGMRRFMDGRYSSTPGKPGIVLGYVQKDDPEAVIASINVKIAAETDLDASDYLQNIAKATAILWSAESVHLGGLRLWHFAVDLRPAT